MYYKEKYNKYKPLKILNIKIIIHYKYKDKIVYKGIGIPYVRFILL